MKFQKTNYRLGILLIALLCAGCSDMTTSEVVEAVKECEDAGMQPVQLFNGFTSETRAIVCKVK